MSGRVDPAPPRSTYGVRAPHGPPPRLVAPKSLTRRSDHDDADTSGHAGRCDGRGDRTDEAAGAGRRGRGGHPAAGGGLAAGLRAGRPIRPDRLTGHRDRQPARRPRLLAALRPAGLGLPRPPGTPHPPRPDLVDDPGGHGRRALPGPGLRRGRHGRHEGRTDPDPPHRRGNPDPPAAPHNGRLTRGRGVPCRLPEGVVTAHSHRRTGPP
ncbi:hypothetical protein SBRY_20498 [Actinacidiphila bryophytorum]|uniref:Uncharacterized protein n=1 Tax=Actinacidiphila bryophytorum TaxID=1436133 RepID=A0A9W4EDS8_9ACTN|nr:hypothetical protein SBRY_20498 [Actinacidiphila bryophytorum]